MTSLFEVHLLGGAAVFFCLIAVCLFVILPLAVLGRGPCCRIMLALSLALAASPAMAQKPKAATASDACNPQVIFKTFNLQTFINNLQQCSVEDINAAIAVTPKDDQQALACFQTLLTVLNQQPGGGVFTALQTYRNARRTQVLGTCSQWLNSTIAPVQF